MPSTGIPSTMYSGSLLLIVPIPLTRTVKALPGDPEFCETCTPAILPWSACSVRKMGASVISSAVTVETAPLILLRFCVP